jgi:hypothetical protein
VNKWADSLVEIVEIVTQGRIILPSGKACVGYIAVGGHHSRQNQATGNKFHPTNLPTQESI